MIDLNEVISKLFLSSPFSFSFVKNEKGLIHTSISEELCEFIVLREDQIVGHTLYDFYPKEHAEKKTVLYERALAGETVIDFVEPLYHLSSYLLKLEPIFENGVVTHVEGICFPVPSNIFAVA